MKMESSNEPISLRNGRLFNAVLTRSGPMQRYNKMKVSQDTLLDAFILLYDECTKGLVRMDSRVHNFLTKYKTLIHYIKSLRVNLDDFEIQQVVGKGYFGEVKVVKEKQTNDFYAMKAIKKYEIACSTCTVLFEEERDIMCTATSHWLTKLQYSFQDQDKLYFIMEYNEGGDLLSLLKSNNGRFTPETARFYLAETALAIKALHQMGYVHRDIKPENILLDRCGHIKLGDFGCAAKLSSQGMVSQPMPKGTPKYIAPEILCSLESCGGDKNRKECYGKECDYWSLGILAYELVVGRYPFTCSQIKSIYYNIMKQKKRLWYPEDLLIPETLRDLISKLLEDRKARLQHDGVVRHSFFTGLNWTNIRNEVPPFVPTPQKKDYESNSSPLQSKKLLLRGEVKDNCREFSAKNLPFIGFSYSGSTDNEKSLNNECNDSSLEKKSPVVEALLDVARRENKNLLSKLFEGQFGKSGEIENLQKKLEEKNELLALCEQEKNGFQRELSKARTEYTNMCKMLEFEKRNRREVESNALRLIAEAKVRVQRDVLDQTGELSSKIEKLNDRLTEAHTINNELTSRNDRLKAELLAANNEIEILKKLEIDFKNKLTEAREFKRKSVFELESRLDKMATENQTHANILQKKLNEKATAKTELEEQLKQMETAWLAKESQYKQDIKEYEDKINKLELKINTQNLEIASLQAQLCEKPNVALLQEQLEFEKNECFKLQTRISVMEQELTNTTHSFLDHESMIIAHEEAVQVLEKELREASEEKVRLQKKLQETKETDELNRQKLSNLEIVVDRLEQGVLKLEAENAKLKQRAVERSHPISSEAETRYQERILVLEDQIAKLENQLQKLRETSVLDKESLKTTQTALWKVEKELSDAKIDIRIVKREAKTSEDLAKKLQEDVKKLNEKLEEAEAENHKKVMAEREKIDKLCLEKADLRSEINQKELEIKVLKNKLEEFNELKDLEKQLKKEYSELCQKYTVLEKQEGVLKEEKEKLKEHCQALETEKLKLEATAEELKHKICSLELNNQVLKETGVMLDEQLEDYDKFTTTQTQKIEALTKEKGNLEKEMEKIQTELRTCKQTLNEEKSLKIRAEQRLKFLEIEIANRDKSLTKLLSESANRETLLGTTKMQLGKTEETVAVLEVEVALAKQKYEALNDEFQWLKKETSSYLSSLYSLRESNYKTSQDLEEAYQMIDALRERIEELQNVITHLEAFHKQREVKDEATKHQQSKLISFLQEKLEEAKKKKTLTDVLFGVRSKDYVPSVAHPYKLETLKRCRNSSKNLLNTPNAKEALLELVKSPSHGNSQCDSSVQKMHKFKNELMQLDKMCESCQSLITRGAQGSTCIYCGVQTHSNCVPTVPKTCDLPQVTAQSTVKVHTDGKIIDYHESDNPTVEGWVKILNSNKTFWERRYVILQGKKLSVFEKPSFDKKLLPIWTLTLCSNEAQLLIRDEVNSDEVPNTPKANIPSIIKIVKILFKAPQSQETYYLMILNALDKIKWLSALSSIAQNSGNSVFSNTLQKYQGSPVYSMPKENILNLSCIAQMNDKIILLGAEEGLFSLKLNTLNATAVHINGPTKIRQLTLVPQIGIALMIATHTKRLFFCDYRALLSNAEAASCAHPKIYVNDVNSNVVDEDCLMFAVSPNIEGLVYLTASTSTKLCLMTWCMKTSQFMEAKVMETFHPCNCVVYTKHSVIVGCDKLFEIKLKNFYVQEFLHSSVKSLAFWKVGSFPIEIFEVTKDEYLLCFNEFGVFVNENGKKTQCDLKWNKVPYGFAFAKPYLFVVHMSSIEVIRVSFFDPKSAEDSICTSSTSTVSDSVHINLDNPQYLGYATIPGAIYVSVSTPEGLDIVLLEGNKIYKDDLGSCASLDTGSEDYRNKGEGDEFSFTSSLVHSLEEVGSSTPRHSDEESYPTNTISSTGNVAKKVTFTEKKDI